jgi:RNA exonuclease 1
MLLASLWAFLGLDMSDLQFVKHVTLIMFSSLGLFQSLECPDRDNCTRVECIFSHRTDLQPSFTLAIPIDVEPTSKSHRPIPPPPGEKSIPSKRTIASTSSPCGPVTSKGSESSGPPRKLQKLSATPKPIAVPTATHTSVSIS